MSQNAAVSKVHGEGSRKWQTIIGWLPQTQDKSKTNKNNNQKKARDEWREKESEVGRKPADLAKLAAGAGELYSSQQTGDSKKAS